MGHYWHTIRKRYLPFYLLTVAMALVLIGQVLLRLYTYADGLWYGAIARNLAEGRGSFWAPRFSATLDPVFQDIPPLFFGLQALFFKLLGAHFPVEQLYSLLVFLLSWWILVLIWRYACHEAGPTVEQADTLNLWFLPAAFWLINEATFRFYPQNLPEATLSLFNLLAVYCLLRAAAPRLRLSDWMLIVFSGLLLLASVLLQGAAGLFPLFFFFLYALVFREISPGAVLARLSALVAAPLLGLGLLLLQPPARPAMAEYAHRWLASGMVFSREQAAQYGIAFLPAFLAGGLLLGYFRGLKKWDVGTGFLRWGVLMLSFGALAAFTLTFSPKTGLHNLLPAVPYVALGLGLLIAEGVSKVLNTLDTESRPFRALQIGGIGLAVGTFLFTIGYWGYSPPAEAARWQDLERLAKVLPEGATIGLDPRLYRPELAGYLQRRRTVSVDTVVSDHPFLLTGREADPPAGYRPVQAPFQYFRLYRSAAKVPEIGSGGKAARSIRNR